MNARKNQYRPQVVFHPGETLKEKLIEQEMGPKEFALRSGKPEKTIISVLKCKSSITPEMAVQFEYVLKIPAHFWLNKQRSYDEFVARLEREEVLSESKDWAKRFPYSEMTKMGWLADRNDLNGKTSELLGFFSVSDDKAWEEYYLNQQLRVSFRISLAQTKEPHALSAWLRRGDHQASELASKPYDAKKFKDSLDRIKRLMAAHPIDFFNQLQAICLESGVKVVHTPCLSKAPISGATRWLGENSPLIQLSGRYKRNDSFWFTFFHEAGHILLHGKKDIFLESIEYSDLDRKKELEADEFAIKWTFSREQRDIMMLKKSITEADIITFAEEFGTHPAMIIGRLQHEGVIPHSVGRHHLLPVNLEEV